MVIARVGKNILIHALASLPAWTPPAGPLLIVSPHPDDETLGAGGLIASRAQDITVVCVTDGENAYEFDDPLALAKMREAEQTAALSQLGVAPDRIVRLRMVDSNVATHELELANRLAQLATPNTTIIAPWEGDFHPDHETCGRAAAAAAKSTGATLISYFFWTWHRGIPQDIAGQHLVKFTLDPTLLEHKEAALQEHRSQLQHADGEPILPERLLGPARRSFEVFALR